MSKLSEYTDFPTLDGTEIFPILRAGDNGKAGMAALRAYMGLAFGAYNGKKFSLDPISLTGQSAKTPNAVLQYGETNFAGNFYKDPVLALGINVDTSAGVESTARDQYGMGWWLEQNYEPVYGSHTSTSATTTTVVVAGTPWTTDYWKGWTVNITSGAASGQSSKITGNTNNTLTFSPAITGLTGVVNFDILEGVMEAYLQFSQSAGQYRSVRPFFFNLQRSTHDAQPTTRAIASVSGGSLNVFNFATNHGLSTGARIKIGSFTGGTWSTKNFTSWNVTYVSDTAISLQGFDGTGLGTFVSGSIELVPQLSTTWIMAATGSGLEIRTPSWTNGIFSNTATGDTFAQFVPGYTYLKGANTGGTRLYLLTDNIQSSSGEIYFQYKGTDSLMLTSNFFGYCSIRPMLSGTAVEIMGIEVTGLSPYNANVSIGPNGHAFVPGMLNVNSLGCVTTRPTLVTVAAASQTGDWLQMFASDQTTKQFFLDANRNFVPFGAGTGPAVGDTNGFQYIAKVAGAPTGVPANLAGAYANSVPMRYDSTNNRLYIYNGAWRSVLLS